MRPWMNVNGKTYLGADPEIFLRDKHDRVVSSGMILPTHEVKAGKLSDGRTSYAGSIAQDGIQAEFHPAPRTCRQEVSLSLSAAMQTLERLAKEQGARLDFTSVIEIPEDNFAALPDHAKELGCGRSLNVWDPTATVGVDGQTYRIRSAAGHVHLGLGQCGSEAFCSGAKDLHENIPTLVKLLDLIVGNTCVMLDRDPLAAKRRETYGRAGEYRTTPYGMEYRTLSNFWLRGPQLASLVWDLSRTAVALWTYAYPVFRFSFDSSGAYVRKPTTGYMFDLNEIFSLVDPGDVVTAINTNDFDLARSNYNKIRGWFAEYGRKAAQVSAMVSNALNAESQAGLDQLIVEGIDRHFPAGDPTEVVERWRNFVPNGYLPGWESWCEHTRLGQLTELELQHESRWNEWRNAPKGVAVRW